MSVILNAYLLRNRVRGIPLTNPHDAIDPDRQAAPVPLRPDLPFDGRLYAMASDPTPPDWETFLEQGTSGPLDLEKSATNSAVLLVRVPRNDEDRWVAFTFGLGRYLLNRDWLERRFGLRVCLNLAYPRGEIFDGSVVPARLKTIDAKTIEE